MKLVHPPHVVSATISADLFVFILIIPMRVLFRPEACRGTDILGCDTD